MPAPLSIVIPTLNAAPDLPPTLARLVEGLSAGLLREVIVSDGGSTDATETLAEEWGARLVVGDPGRGGQLRRGVTQARGDWVLVLHADTHLPDGWSAMVETAMTQPEVAHVFALSFRAKGMQASWVAGWANVRTRLFGLPYGDQGLLISRALYDQIGGYADIRLMEDVALARALRGRIRLLPGRVSTGADRYVADGWLRRGTRNLWALARYLCGADPEHLASGYRPRSAQD